MQFTLGNEAKDKITGFRGVITGYSEYLTGCDQYLLQPSCENNKDYDFKEGRWFDEGRIEIIKPNLTPEDVKGKKKGACGSAPIK